MELIDLPDHLITKVNVNEYEAIQTIVAEQTKEYSQILDTNEAEELYPMVQEQLPNLDKQVALEVLRTILPVTEN